MPSNLIEVYHKVTGQRQWMAAAALSIFTDYAAVPVGAPPPLIESMAQYIQDTVGEMVLAGPNVTVDYDPDDRKLTIGATGGGTSTPPSTTTPGFGVSFGTSFGGPT
jgi:hypothetical protein